MSVAKTFKQQAFQDINNVFLNMKEFGETHKVNGKPVQMVIDANEVEERGKKQFEHSKIDGIFKESLVVYVSRSEFGNQPARGSSFNLDGKNYRVTDSRDEGGMYSIILEAYRS